MTAAPTRTAASEDRIRGLLLVAGMVVVMWVLEAVDALGAHLDNDGIHPRDVDGLPGIVVAPFLHAGWGHLIGNTIPFLVLGFAIALGGLARTAAVTVIVVLVAGFGTWLIGARAHEPHRRQRPRVRLRHLPGRARHLQPPRRCTSSSALLVLAIYGTTLAFGLVPTPGISWQGHLFGAIGGVVAARFIHARQPSPAAS